MKNQLIKLSLFLNYFVFAILLNSVGTVILQVQNHFGVSESQASVLEAFKDLSIAAMSFVVASFITRIGYRKSMLIALGLVSAACFAMPALNSFWATKLLFATVGVSFALIKISVYGTIGLLTGDNRSAHISLMSFIESFFMVGVVAGYFIFSRLVDANWMQIYYGLGSVSLLALLLLLLAQLDESAAHHHVEAGARVDVAAMFRLMALPLVVIFLLCAFLYVLIEQSIMSWLPTYNQEVLGLPTALAIQMSSILAASTAVGRMLAGFALRKFNWFSVLTACLVLAAGLVLLAIPMATQIESGSITGWATAPPAAFVFPMIGLLLAPIYPAINSLILSALPTHQHGVMSGLIIVFSALGGTTGSIITGNLFQRLGGEQAFYFSLLPIGLLLVGLWLFRRRLSE